MADTKQRLLDGAMAALREHGIAGISARTIAAAAGVNQALVFYHYGSVDELLAAACLDATQTRIAAYRDELEAAASIRELLAVGRTVLARERELGNVSVLAQLLAGAQSQEKLREPVLRAVRLWTDEIERILTRHLADSPFAEIADIPGLAEATTSAFIGLELYGGLDQRSGRALDALDQLAVLIEVTDELGPIARRALRSRVSRAARRRKPATRS
jgi:AcrR family transcriptional regulator